MVASGAGALENATWPLMLWRDNGGACACGARSNLLRIIHTAPPHRHVQRPDGSWGWDVVKGEWSSHEVSRCVDRQTCTARFEKRRTRSKVRASMLVVAEPKAPDAPKGTCRWCGEKLTGANGERRNYCYLDREGRDCQRAWWRSRAFTARDAVTFRGDPVCAECGSDGSWAADHIVALEDGGEHTMENLQRLCDPCHHTKTARENAARRAAARVDVPSAQLRLDAA